MIAGKSTGVSASMISVLGTSSPGNGGGGTSSGNCTRLWQSGHSHTAPALAGG
jgi:hypothetical protein